jgi:hypothetical protein
LISRRTLPIGISLAFTGLLIGSAMVVARPGPEPAIESAPPVLAEWSPEPEDFLDGLPPEQLASVTRDFLGSLRPEQRARAVFRFEDAERINWHYVPRARRGLPLREMSPEQQELARRILRTALSQRGYVKANTIIELELVLQEMGGNPRVRDPELYYFSVFGTPGSQEPWGLRAEGHHLSLNVTVVGDSLVATAPAFMGANPAEVRVGSRVGLRALAAEEDLARELIHALDEDQRAAAVIARVAPRDIVTGSAARVAPLSPIGIRVSELSAHQARLLVRLIDEYLDRMAEPLAERRRAALEQTDFGQVAFAWAGALERGRPHYYRIQGPSFLIEYDNSQNGGNHIHTVWRDFDGDFGRDLIREHYRAGPHSHD